MKEEAMSAECPLCDGAGWTVWPTADPLPSGEPGEPYQVRETCIPCGGAGRLPILDLAALRESQP